MVIATDVGRLAGEPAIGSVTLAEPHVGVLVAPSPSGGPEAAQSAALDLPDEIVLDARSPHAMLVDRVSADLDDHRSGR